MPYDRDEALIILDQDRNALTDSDDLGLDASYQIAVRLLRANDVRLVRRQIDPIRAAGSRMPFAVTREDAASAQFRQLLALLRRGQLEDKGYDWFIEIDVRNCYASLNADGVKELLRALPEEVVEANVLSRSTNATIRKTRRKLSSIDLCKLRDEVRSGIPQGSLLSPLVAEVAMASVADEVICPPVSGPP